jgi:RNA polymerase sigma-70 factor (ECF subfamily)
VASSLEGLPEEQREVVTMHLWGGLTFAEIAEALGASINTVAARYRYALKALQRKLEPMKEVLMEPAVTPTLAATARTDTYYQSQS